MVIRRVLEAIDETLFARQAGDEMEVGFTGLHTELAYLVLTDAPDFITADALTLQHQFKDLRYGFLLEDAPV